MLGTGTTSDVQQFLAHAIFSDDYFCKSDFCHVSKMHMQTTSVKCSHGNLNGTPFSYAKKEVHSGYQIRYWHNPVAASNAAVS